MATTAEKLAQSLEALKKLQENGVVAISTKQLSRIHRERLTKNGFLLEVIKGWYIPSRPEQPPGESTAWYAAFWAFCSSYLSTRFATDWCLSPEQSLLIHAENWTVPKQLLVHSSKGRNKVTQFLHNTSLLDARYNMPESQQIEEKNGIRIFSLPSALVNASPKFFIQYPIEARAALTMVREPSELLRLLLAGCHSVIAGRLCGAFRNIGQKHIADEIKRALSSAGFDVREYDPFTTKPLVISAPYALSPAVHRMNILWHEMRNAIINNFPNSPGLPLNIDEYLKCVEANYVNDAYHSLSIEGYQVNPALIEKVRAGNWDPDHVAYDRNQRNALAARGYWQAFKAVKNSISKILQGNNPGEIAQAEHSEWYRQLFQPSVSAGLLKPTDLAGYRNSFVYIRQSKHVPPRCEVMRDLMPAFFANLCAEQTASVRVVLSHFFFVYIHPYMDGNGRIGRFLMNAMLAAGGYPWTVIPLNHRNEYMLALEEASTQQNIAPFCQFIAGCIIKQ